MRDFNMKRGNDDVEDYLNEQDGRARYVEVVVAVRILAGRDADPDRLDQIAEMFDYGMDRACHKIVSDNPGVLDGLKIVIETNETTGELVNKHHH